LAERFTRTLKIRLFENTKSRLFDETDLKKWMDEAAFREAIGCSAEQCLKYIAGNLDCNYIVRGTSLPIHTCIMKNRSPRTTKRCFSKNRTKEKPVLIPRTRCSGTSFSIISTG